MRVNDVIRVANTFSHPVPTSRAGESEIKAGDFSKPWAAQLQPTSVGQALTHTVENRSAWIHAAPCRALRSPPRVASPTLELHPAFQCKGNPKVPPKGSVKWFPR